MSSSAGIPGGAGGSSGCEQMNIEGLPGSLVQLLKPIALPAQKQHLFPRNFAALHSLGDIGRVLENIRRVYQQEGKIHLYNRMAEQGTKAEFYFATELAQELSGVEGYIFNNVSISLQTEHVAGVGLTVFPDHLIVMPNSFLYVENKSWSRAYLQLQREKKKAQIREQLEGTLKIISMYLNNHSLHLSPPAYLYDDQGSFGRDCPGCTVVEKPREIADIALRENNSSPSEYRALVSLFQAR